LFAAVCGPAGSESIGSILSTNPLAGIPIRSYIAVRTHDRRVSRASQKPDVFDRMPRGSHAVKVTTRNEKHAPPSHAGAKTYSQFSIACCPAAGAAAGLRSRYVREGSMGMLISGPVMLLAVVVMVRITRPNPDGSPVRFLARDGLATVYALLLTTFIGLGIGLTVSGTSKVVAIAVARVN
jgi:hypothetical protein